MNRRKCLLPSLVIYFLAGNSFVLTAQEDGPPRMAKPRSVAWGAMLRSMQMRAYFRAS